MNKNELLNIINSNIVKLKNNNLYNESYMSWTDFIKLFPKIYNLVYFDGINWYWKPDIIIHLSFNSDLYNETGIIFTNNRCFNNK